MYNKLIVIFTLLFLLRFYYCITGKKTSNPYSACSDNPHWGRYGYKLSLLIYLNIIIIILITRKNT